MLGLVNVAEKQRIRREIEDIKEMAEAHDTAGSALIAAEKFMNEKGNINNLNLLNLSGLDEIIKSLKKILGASETLAKLEKASLDARSKITADKQAEEDKQSAPAPAPAPVSNQNIERQSWMSDADFAAFVERDSRLDEAAATAAAARAPAPAARTVGKLVKNEFYEELGKLLTKPQAKAVAEERNAEAEKKLASTPEILQASVVAHQQPKSLPNHEIYNQVKQAFKDVKSKNKDIADPVYHENQEKEHCKLHYAASGLSSKEIAKCEHPGITDAPCVIRADARSPIDENFGALMSKLNEKNLSLEVDHCPNIEALEALVASGIKFALVGTANKELNARYEGDAVKLGAIESILDAQKAKLHHHHRPG